DNVRREDGEQDDAKMNAVAPGAAPVPLARSAAEPPQVPAAKPQSRDKAATVSNWLAAGNLLISLAYFIFMYKWLPLKAATELQKIDPALGGRIAFNLVDGGIRLVLFLLFIWGVSLWKDIRRVYEYHGAEHKTVFAFEDGKQLVPAEVQKYSTYHPRCGTSFLMTVMLISIGFYMLVPFTTFWARFAS